MVVAEEHEDGRWSPPGGKPDDDPIYHIASISFRLQRLPYSPTPSYLCQRDLEKRLLLQLLCTITIDGFQLEKLSSQLRPGLW